MKELQPLLMVAAWYLKSVAHVGATRNPGLSRCKVIRHPWPSWHGITRPLKTKPTLAARQFVEKINGPFSMGIIPECPEEVEGPVSQDPDVYTDVCVKVPIAPWLSLVGFGVCRIGHEAPEVTHNVRASWKGQAVRRTSSEKYKQ